MAGYPLALPDGLQIDGAHSIEAIEPGDTLCRVFSHVDAAAKGYSALSWNPSRHPLGGVDAGRFDLLPGTGSGGYLYGSQSDNDSEQVAIIETFRTALMKSRDVSRANRRYMLRDFRDARSIVRFTVTEPLSLVCIRKQRSREPFRMEEEVQYSGDRDGTRKWGEFIRSSIKDAGGIAYNSTTETARRGFCSFIVWQERLPANIFAPLETIPLGQPRGRRIVENAVRDYGVFWM